jgi:hypothetical protein
VIAPAALGAILAASVVVDLVFFTGFIASDDVLYVTAARKLAETGTLWPDLAAHEVRLMMIGWCALVGLGVRGEPHPGDGTWRPLEAVVPVPLGFDGGEARIVLLHAGTQGHSDFADVEVSVR